MNPKILLNELLAFGCIKEGREKTALSLMESHAVTIPETSVILKVDADTNEVVSSVSAADLDAVADEQKAKEATKGTVN